MELNGGVGGILHILRRKAAFILLLCEHHFPAVLYFEVE